MENSISYQMVGRSEHVPPAVAVRPSSERVTSWWRHRNISNRDRLLTRHFKKQLSHRTWLSDGTFKDCLKKQHIMTLTEFGRCKRLRIIITDRTLHWLCKFTFGHIVELQSTNDCLIRDPSCGRQRETCCTIVVTGQLLKLVAFLDADEYWMYIN